MHNHRPKDIIHLLRTRNLILAALVVALLATVSCGTNKNTATSRNWQAFTTRYNVYFNGIEHYKTTLKNMESNYEDDYTTTVMMHPAEAKANPKLPQPSGDFKRTIEKMQKAIQLHSIKKKPASKSGSAKEKEFRAREEFNPFLHNAWMTMGKAQFMGGDFLGAAATFSYISKHFKWLPATTMEARIWEARCYCALDWRYEAENILRKINPEKLESKPLQVLYNEAQADYYIHAEEFDKAIPYLEFAAKNAKGAQKNRQWFLLGQILAKTDKKQLAYEAFRKAGAGASTPYRTKFNARIKQSEVFTGNNIRSEVNALKAMIRYERNSEYLDQIYYAIGNLYITRRDTNEAIKNYALAIEKSTRNGIDKALAQLALGAIYFTRGEYEKAQPLYAEAVSLISDNYPDYKLLKRRSDVLDELSTYAGNVHLQDSLLDLSKLSPEEQMKACERLAEELKKREKEAAEAELLEQYKAKQQELSSRPGMGNNNAPATFTMNSDRSWYFYNQQAKNTGKTEFMKRWGARKLEDDWRRRNKNTFSFEETGMSDGEENTQENDTLSAEDKAINDSIQRADDPHNPEYYLKQIPKTEEEIQTCNDIIIEGLYNMGIILKDKLEDYPAARKEFNELDTRYPYNTYRLDVYYNMYLMAVREDDVAQAEKYRQLILEEFPESPYGIAMADPQYFNNLRRMHQIQESKYAETYEAYLDNDNEKVRELTAEMEKEYPLSPLLPKFVFLDALSYVTDGDTENFKAKLQELLQKWPDTDMTEIASGMLKNLTSGRNLQGGGENSRGMLWDTRLIAGGGSDNAVAADGQPANFERDPNSPQYLVYAFPRDSVNANQLLYDVARFNFSSFVTGDFDLEQMAFGNVGLLIVKGFSNLKRLEHYRAVMDKSEFKLPESVRPIMISKPNFELLLREGRSFEEYFQFEERAATEATEESVVGPDNTMPPGPDDAVEEEVEKDDEEEPTAEPAEEAAEDEPDEQPEQVPDEAPEATVPEEPQITEESEETQEPQITEEPEESLTEEATQQL